MSGGLAIQVLGHGFLLLAQVWPSSIFNKKKESQKKNRWGAMTHNQSSYFWIFFCFFFWRFGKNLLQPINPIQGINSHPIGEFPPRNGSQRSRLKGCSAWDSWGEVSLRISGVGIGIHDHMIPNTRLFTWMFSEGQLDKHFLTFWWGVKVSC